MSGKTMSSLRLTRPRPDPSCSRTPGTATADRAEPVKADHGREDPVNRHSDVSQPDVRHPAEPEAVTAGEGLPTEETSIASVPQPLLNCEVMTQDWNISASSGRSARFRIMDEVIEGGTHPLKGLRCGRGRNGMSQAQRLRIVITKPEETGESSLLYHGEGTLLSWSDDCRLGMRLSLRLDSGPEGVDWHPLSGVDADNNAGEVVMVTVWGIADDECLQDARKATRRSTPFYLLPPVKQSQIKCRLDEDFRKWTRLAAPGLLPADELPEDMLTPIQYAEQFVRAYCQVESRSEMSHDTATGFAARERWREIMRMYDEHRRG